jgi:hypothetical protein
MAENNLIIFPTSSFLDKNGNISMEWMLWLQNPQFVTLTVGTPFTIKQKLEYLAPVTGFSHTIDNKTNCLILKPATILASGTAILPASPSNGQNVEITSSKMITAFTVLANAGQFFDSIPPVFTLGFASWVFQSSDATWYRTG